MIRLVLASNNAKKLSELQSLLSGLALQLVPQRELGVDEAEEPFPTFVENALAKARHAAAAAGGAALADDSGVCVDALGGEPGVVSAHYAGDVAAAGDDEAAAPVGGVARIDDAPGAQAAAEAGGPGAGLGIGLGTEGDPGAAREARRRRQDAANNALLLHRLEGIPPGAGRSACYVSTLVAVRHAGDPQPLVAVGRWHGEILEAPRGTLGFGYDPLMWIGGLGQTVAEMDAATKNANSHRALAMAQLRAQMREVWRL